ncbi:MAG TPA: type II toxin-antitoxin system RelE/ParE family toxin, partial [Leptospiraceae bacterium]|nr:type II toxin-antitoxin system RelE/ParE family toxin [Leptospiraceae bacterium]
LGEKYKLKPEAKKDLVQAVEWYEKNQEGVGLRLYEEVYDKIEALSKKPNSHSTFYREFRKASLKVFPFLIIYIIKEPIILIFAIWHKSRDSKKLLERVDRTEKDK